MKIWIMIFFCLLMIGCGWDGKGIPERNTASQAFVPKENYTPDTSTSPVAYPKKGLDKEIPLSSEKIKELLPEKIALYSRTKLIMGDTESLGYSGLIATYQYFPGAEKSISVEIIDGAGTAGAVMVHAAEERLKLDFEEKKANGYIRIFQRENLRVKEKEDTFDSYSEVEFVYQNRFHYLFRAYKTPIHELWEFIVQTGFLTS
ncbi:hypothetical protein [Shivajiella indica]|uniref:Lipoprotein n=1 Tax=Shivajiella indica TaxID=872115 RepID=A0ABW5BD82_9BACT